MTAACRTGTARRARWALGLLLAAGAITAACSSGSQVEGLDLPTATTSPASDGTVPAVAPAQIVDATGKVTFSRLALGAGGFVTGLVVHPSGVTYARTDVGGAYRYDDATRTWRQMIVSPGVADADPSRNDLAVESIAVAPSDPEVVLVSVGDDPNPETGTPLSTTGRVLRSADGGRTWAASTNTFFVSGNQERRQRSERLVIDPFDARHVLLGTRRQGLWESKDGGATFRQISTAAVPVGLVPRPEADHAGVSFVAFDPSATGRIYAGVAGVGVLRSDDAGITWRTVIAARGANDVPFEGTVVAGSLFVSLSIVEGDGNGDIGFYDPGTNAFRSTKPDARSNQWSGAVDPFDPKHIVITEDALRSGHLWSTTNGGATWTTHDVRIDATSIPWLQRTDLVEFMSVGRLVFDPRVRGRLWFAEGMGVWRTEDLAGTRLALDAITFTLESRGIEELVIADVVAPPNGAVLTVAADRQGFRSTDRQVYPSAPLVDARFVGGTDLDYSGLDPKSLVWIGAEYHRYFDSARTPRAAVSADGGITWTELKNLDKDMFGGNVAMSAGDPQNIVWLPSYFLSPYEYRTDPRPMFVTTDGGAHWTRVTVGGRADHHRLMWWLTKQALVSDKVANGVFYLQSEAPSFFVSADGGRTWTQAPYSAPCTEAVTCHVRGQLVASPTNAGEVWSSAADAGLYRTTDQGRSPWQRIAGVATVRAFGLGAPSVAGGPPTVYLYGTVGSDPALGFWRSTDAGASWSLLGRAPLGLYTSVTSVTGDAGRPDRFYVGFGGSGVVVGDVGR